MLVERGTWCLFVKWTACRRQTAGRVASSANGSQGQLWPHSYRLIIFSSNQCRPAPHGRRALFRSDMTACAWPASQPRALILSTPSSQNNQRLLLNLSQQRSRKAFRESCKNLAFFTVLFVTTYLRGDEKQRGYPGMRRGKEGSSACADSRHCRSRTEHDYWLIFLHRLSNLYTLLLLLRQYRRFVIQSLLKVDKNSSCKKHPLINQKWLRLCLCIHPRCLNFTKPSTLSSLVCFPLLKAIHLLKKAAF